MRRDANEMWVTELAFIGSEHERENILEERWHVVEHMEKHMVKVTNIGCRWKRCQTELRVTIVNIKWNHNVLEESLGAHIVMLCNSRSLHHSPPVSYTFCAKYLGKWTWRPECVVRVVGVAGGGVTRLLEWGWGVGEVGWVCKQEHLDVSVSGAVSVVSRCAGFRWSIEMVSVRLFILMVKCLSVQLMMGYGPL